MQKQRKHIRASSTYSRVLLFFLVIMLFLSNLSALFQGSSADPSIQDNGDGTMTGRWTFQNPANYTSANLSISPNSVTLKAKDVRFLDTSLADFQQGTVFNNVNVTSQPGNVILNDTGFVSGTKTVEILVNESDGKDTYIRKGWENMNYGASWTIHTRYNSDRNTTTLIQFNLSRAPDPDLITSAELLLKTHRANATVRSVSVYRFEEDWTEGTGNDTMSNDGATWRTSNGVDNWTVEGGSYWPVPEDTLDVYNDTINWQRWNVTQLVKDWINGVFPNYGMILRTDDVPFAEKKRFFGKESLLPDGIPRLEVNYSDGQTNGTFVSRTFDAQEAVNWGNISWSAITPAGTKLAIQTRSGDCSGSWNNWSQEYSTTTGSRISSPASRCIQYKVEMSTTNTTQTPVLEEVVIDNRGYEVDTDMDQFLMGTGLHNIDAISSPGSITLNNTILGAPPKIVEVPIDFGDGHDVFIDESFSKKNYGASALLELDIAKKTRVLVKFDTSSVQNPQWINRSEIWMKPSPGMSGTIQCNISVHEVTTDWIEGTGTGSPTRDGATWETSDGSNPWLTMGGDFNLIPEYTLMNMTGQAGWHKWNITRLAGEWFNGTTPNYGALFEIHFGGFIADLKAFYSKQYAGPLDRPKLVIYYNASGPSQANGTFVSRTLDAQSNVSWGNISWDSVVPPGTDASVHTRSGDCAGNWSGWSQAYLTPSGSQITSIPGGCLQYKAELVTYANGTKPVLEEVRIEYSKYFPEGSLETEDFTPVDWLGWESFDATFVEPLGTNISFQYSVSTGAFWASIFAGEDIRTLLAPTIRFRANFKSSDQSLTPELYEMNVTYRVKTVLDHIHMSRANWTGTTDEWVDIDAIGHDLSHLNVSFIQKWETDDPWGSVNSTGVYLPGMAGSWRVFCNNSDDSISNYSKVTVLPGNTSSITISPWDPGTLSTDDMLMFNVTGYDSMGNTLGPVMANWSVTGGIGNTTPGPATSSVFDPTTPGTGQVWADDGMGHTNSTNIIQVVAGNRSRIGIEPWSPGPLTTDDNVNFAAYSYDSDDNQIGPAIVSWFVSGGIGTIPVGPSQTAVFDATTVGVGTITIDDGMGLTNTTDLILVIAGQLATIVLNPASVILLTEEYQNFSAEGYDSDGNTVPIITPLWETNAGTIVNSSANGAMLQAQNTELSNGWIRVTAVFQNNVTANSTIDVAVVNVKPSIVGTIPSQQRMEDYGSWTLDLSSVASDPQDSLSELTWFFTENDPSLITISGDEVIGNHIMTFTTVKDAYGNDEMTIWLRDSDGQVDGQIFWVNITPVNDNPIIQSITPFTVHYDEPYTYYFYDYVEDVETAREDLVLTSSQPGNITFNGLWGTFTYPQEFNGETVYPIITVHDEHGGEMSTVIAITISDDYVPVLVRELPDVTLFEGEELLDYFDLDDYFDDPDEDSLYYTSGNVNTQIIIHDNNSVDFIAPADWNGVETVSFSAIDPENARAEDIILVTVLPINDAPTISGVPDLVVRYDDPSRPDYNYTFDLEPYIYDVDNNISELVVTTNDPTNIFFYAPLNAVMALHYPESMKGQTVTVRITVSDGSSIAYQDILVTILDNWPPETSLAIPDFTLYEDIPLPNAFSLDSYFFDPEGGSLTYSSISSNVSVNISVSDSNVGLSSALNWFGEEYVTFRAMDSLGAILEQTIRVTVLPENDAPTIDPIPDQEVVKGRMFTVDLSDYVHDVDNDFSELVIQIQGSLADSTITVAGSFLVFSYGSEGIDHIQLSVSDGNKTTYATFNVVVVGPPVPTIWDQIYWPWSLLVALLAFIIAFLLARQFLGRIFIGEAFLIHGSGKLIKRIPIGSESSIDDGNFSGMLAAIQSFIHDSFKEVEASPVKRVEFGDRKIMIERGEHIYLAVVYSGRENRRNVRPLKDALGEIEATYSGKLEGLEGPVEEFEDIEDIIRKNLKN
jgi:hypothetical protein